METFKERYSDTFLQRFAGIVQRHTAALDEQRFDELVHRDGWEELAFKQRIRRISEALTGALQLSFAELSELLIAMAPECRGVEYLFFPDCIELNGLTQPELSMNALEKLTAYSSSEFAVRPFIVQDMEGMLAQMRMWALHKDEHVRRLASEGFRPRLPWSFQLRSFVADPEPTLAVLELLKRDPSLYVRKSVANHLNDIAKDHPERIVAVAQSWYGQHADTDWIVKHGCRTLLKQDHPAMMELFGYLPSEHIRLSDLQISRTTVPIGEEVELSFVLHNEAATVQNVRIDYEMQFMKANGQQAPKRFRWVSRNFAHGRHVMRKKHSFKLITTRVYYPGLHHVHLYVNGVQMGEVSFEVTAAE
ncbi:DNA alkylation repair protein [Paenibacillus campi]|uniref:DNA alkylation repair protein n=1 Tax=Paenibacillus campi TaxID=3106031 RepID=UPI002AFE880A|nr:DNA alkylation repair protein [Paenibacillus sp. SGZ-1014]